MKAKYISIIIILVASLNSLHAQQRMQYSQFMQNGFLLNPAIAGMEKYSDLKGGYTKQWAGFVGSPQGQFVSFSARIGSDSIQANTSQTSIPLRGRKNNVIQSTDNQETIDSIQKFHQGIGLTIFSEGDDVIMQNELSVSYAMHFPLKNKQFISAGISGGLRQNRFDPTSIKLINQNDLIFGNQIRNIILPNFNLGVLWYSDNFFVGLSANQAMNSSYSYDRLEPNPASTLKPHFYFNAGYKFKATELISITPSIIVRKVFPSPISIDLNAMADYKDLIRVGFSYRNKESIVAIVGFCVSHRISINYSFDYVTSDIKAYGTGTHGIILGARLGNKSNTFIPKYFW
jgi:type IX secretion system PorP/SprF family membrane protein